MTRGCRPRHGRIAAALFAGTQFLTGCGQPGGPAADRSPPDADRIVASTHQTFHRAIYYKPADDVAAERAALAPLIVQELAGRRAAHIASRPGNAAGTPTIYRVESVARLSRGAYRQLAYAWAYPGRRRADPPRWRTVRVTFASDGAPAIWEAFADDDPARRIFVSAALESRAALENGPPLPGRRFSIERSLADAPQAVVPRTLADGPQPMGPFVYLDAALRFTTLLCRCMPSQFDQADETLNYRLVDFDPADPAAGMTIPIAPDLALGGEPADSLDRLLRLPGAW
ncbi:MAG: hypothetical protein U1A27_11150 [Phycisphaerae bacterium]